MSYDKMLDLLTEVRLVITDSGGIQEECSFLNKKCLTCRKVTERPEAIGQSTFMVESPDKLYDVFREHIHNFEIDYVCPFGDGHSAEKIVDVFKKIGI
jgi:UDP-N-acetylglucosamine 2-epimerase (non-hydrolysing)